MGFFFYRAPYIIVPTIQSDRTLNEHRKRERKNTIFNQKQDLNYCCYYCYYPVESFIQHKTIKYISRKFNET